jgi:hypothetical protein
MNALCLNGFSDPAKERVIRERLPHLASGSLCAEAWENYRTRAAHVIAQFGGRDVTEADWPVGEPRPQTAIVGQAVWRP